MLVLHTSDWHVGRTIRGRSRAGEHRAALDQVVAAAAEHAVDLVLVAGDQFDVQAPSPEAEQIVWAALQRLAEVAPVVVIAGNHDNPRRLEAVRGLLAAHRIHAGADTARPEDGGVVRLRTADGTDVAVALLPFLHHRNAVAAVDLLDPGKGDGDYAASYTDRFQRYAHGLCAGMTAGSVNLAVSHVTCFGAELGGGERQAHSLDRYCVDARSFPGVLDYVALGHVHLAQDVGTAPPVRYCGAPLAMDFGEGGRTCSVSVVEVEVGRPRKVTAVPVTSGRDLLTVRGTFEQACAADVGDAWVRVLLSGPVPAGVAEEVRARLGDGVVEVRLDRRDERAPAADTRLGQAPAALFTAFLATREISDPRVPALFDALLERAREEGAGAAA